MSGTATYQDGPGEESNSTSDGALDGQQIGVDSTEGAGETGDNLSETPGPAPVESEIQVEETKINPNCCFTATRYGGGAAYGDSIDYNGLSLGCGLVSPGSGTRYYSSGDTYIMAVSPGRYNEWGCGSRKTVCNPVNNQCLKVMRLDSCPGCGYMHIDLSEEGIRVLCGYLCGRVDGLIVYDGW